MTRELTWSEYVEWVQSKTVQSEVGDVVYFTDGSCASFSAFLSSNGCDTCGFGREIKMSVNVKEAE